MTTARGIDVRGDERGYGPPQVLVVDDDLLHTRMVVGAIEQRVPGAHVQTASSVRSACARLLARRIDAVVLDVGLPDGDGLGVVQVARRHGDDVPFVLLTADGSAQTAVRALRAGARDYVVKGADAVDRAVAAVEKLVAGSDGLSPDRVHLVGESDAMRVVRSDVRRCGRSEAPVRIEGETGVGKELVARAIHACSARSLGPFVAVNCGALPEALAEVELFGHVRGAYTGAAADRPGLVEHACGGTLMLDEVEDLPASIQGTLLRLLQEKEYRPVGTATARRADVRLLAASNRNLEGMVESGALRADLFYRLDVLRVDVPPLRERLDDIEPLVHHMLARRAGRVDVDPPFPDEWAEMRRHAWPGNVRELENFVERARVVAEVAGWRAGWSAALAALSPERSRVAPSVVAESSRGDLERVRLERLLDRHRWKREAVAQALGVSRVTLWRRMRRHGLIGDA